MKEKGWCINEKLEQGITEGKPVHGAASIFAHAKQNKIRMSPLVDVTARNEITIKGDENDSKPKNEPELASKSKIPKQAWPQPCL